MQNLNLSEIRDTLNRLVTTYGDCGHQSRQACGRTEVPHSTDGNKKIVCPLWKNIRKVLINKPKYTSTL